jgi:hypothetical protein
VGDLVGALVGSWWVLWRGLGGSPSGGTGGALVVVPGDGVEEVGWGWGGGGGALPLVRLGKNPRPIASGPGDLEGAPPALGRPAITKC